MDTLKPWAKTPLIVFNKSRVVWMWERRTEIHIKLVVYYSLVLRNVIMTNLSVYNWIEEKLLSKSGLRANSRLIDQ